MSNTSLQRLREHLFDTIERVKDIKNPEASEEDKINLQAAQAVSKLSSQVIASAKVELDAMKLIHGINDVEGSEILKKSPLFQLKESN